MVGIAVSINGIFSLMRDNGFLLEIVEILFFFLSVHRPIELLGVSKMRRKLLARKARSHKGCLITAIPFLRWELMRTDKIDRACHSLKLTNATQSWPALTPRGKNDRLRGDAFGRLSLLIRRRILKELAADPKTALRERVVLLRTADGVGEHHTRCAHTTHPLYRTVVS